MREEMTIRRPASASTPPLCLTSCLARKTSWPASVAVAALLSGCGGSAVPAVADKAEDYSPGMVKTEDRSPAVAAGRSVASLVRVPRLDYVRPGSVAASFFAVSASVDAVYDSSDAFLARCADLVTPALWRLLAASQPAPVGWQAMYVERMVSLAQVRAVARPADAPPLGPDRIYLRVYAERVTTTTAGRTVTSNGITLELSRRGHRWLVSRLPWY